MNLAFWASRVKQPLNPPESSSVSSSSRMDEICLFTSTRAAAARIATVGVMVAAVNEASPEAPDGQWPRIIAKKKVVLVYSYGLQNNDKVKESAVLPQKP